MQVELHGVGKRFGGVEALRDVSLSIPSGRRVALVGPNGSGKSTLTRVVLGLLGCEGEVLLDGQPPFARRAALARRLAYVPQIAPRFGATVGELVRAVADLRRLDAARIAAFAARLALDLDQLRRRPFRSLSGGTRHKVLLALALSSGASLFVLDEPTATLDVEARAAFFRAFDEMAADATLLLCSHRLEEVRYLVDHVVALEEGRVVFDGGAGDFLAERAFAVVAVEVGAADAAWLRARSFRAGAPGWWARTVAQGEKLPLVAELVGSLGGRLRNLEVRDVESMQPPLRSGGESG